MPGPARRHLSGPSPLWLLFGWPLAGCQGEEAAPGPEVTYYEDIQPLIEANCVGCHREGGIGPVRLDDPAEVAVRADLVVAMVSSGEMPPWQPSDECRPLRDRRGLTD